MLMFGAQKSRPSKILLWPARDSLHVLDAALGADGDGHLVNAGGSKVAARPIGSGNSVVPFDGNAVKRLAPPVVCGNVEPGNGARLVDKLRGFFFERHPVHQVGGSLLGGKTWVQIGRLLGILSPSCSAARQDCCDDGQSVSVHGFPLKRSAFLRLWNLIVADVPQGRADVASQAFDCFSSALLFPWPADDTGSIFGIQYRAAYR